MILQCYRYGHVFITTYIIIWLYLPVFNTQVNGGQMIVSPEREMRLICICIIFRYKYIKPIFIVL